MIFIPRLKVIEPKSELVARMGMAGEFEMVATNVYTGKQRTLAKFPNLILDIGLDRVGVAQGWWANCYVGSGNSVPTEAQTSLDVLVASTTNRISATTSSLATPPYYTQLVVTYRFAQGAAAGNLSEVGVGWSVAGLWSRALILDSGGNPTTITVLADEFLDVVYRLRNYPPLEDVTSEVIIDGVTTTVLARAAEVATVGAWLATNVAGHIGGGDTVPNASRHVLTSGNIAAITSKPSGSPQSGPGAGNASYTNGTYFRDYTTSWSITQGNISGGVRTAFTMMGHGSSSSGLGRMQYQFTPNIQKDATKTMVLAFRNSWGRYTV
jgi:hypothetical protein